MTDYTPQEAAVLAGANLRSVQKAITEKRIKVRLKKGRRLVDETGVYVVAVSASVPDNWKIPTHDLVMIVRNRVMVAEAKRPYRAVHRGEPDDVSLGRAGAWSFNPGRVIPGVQERMALYEKARRELIERNPEILGGTPVIAGTRLNVYAIAARLEGGETVEELRGEYPYVTGEQLEAARLYARANPLRGRPGGRPWLKKSRRS